MSVVDVLTAVALLSGSALALAAAVGLLRLPDVLSRMHAATKPQVLGVLLVLGAGALQLRASVDVWFLLLAALFQLTTAPVAAHLVGRLAHRSRDEDAAPLFVDDLGDDARR